VLDFVQKNEPRYGDVTSIDYQAAQLQVAAAKSMFQELPAKLRARFENEPARFLAFVEDKRNRDEARELGLLKPEAPESPEARPGAAPAPGPAKDGSASQAAPDAPLKGGKGGGHSS